MKNKDWIKKIPGCFGSVDYHFASHPLDSNRAKEMIKSAIDAEATMAEIIEAATDYMTAGGCGEALIKSETKKIRELKL